MIAHTIFLYILSIIAVVSAIMVTVSKNTVHSVFFLILDFISISCLFIMIGAEFLGMIMLIVYVGAVAVLFLFVVMMLNVAQQKNEWFTSQESSGHIPVGLIISAIIFFELIIVVGGWKYKPDLFNTNNLNINRITKQKNGIFINYLKFNKNIIQVQNPMKNVFDEAINSINKKKIYNENKVLTKWLMEMTEKIYFNNIVK